MRSSGTRIILPTLTTILLLLATGCATSSPSSANTVRRSETGRVQSLEEGEVVMVREVTIEGTSGVGGAVAGGVLGYAVGNTIGGGSGRTLARAAGTVGGAAVGSRAQQAATTERGLEITVQLESGEVVVIVQAADEHFDAGDKVRVLRRSDGGARVTQ
jgi:outer membrane lipoprotein SlyB